MSTIFRRNMKYAFQTENQIAESHIERRAKIFETGEYPDKGLSIGPEDLERLVENFSEPVPLLIEHSQNPLELGHLTQVEVIGNELFGTFRLVPEANALMVKSGAKSVSIGLSQDLTRILEVSLVKSPRVPDAQLFSAHRVATTIKQFLSEGRLLPCQADLAKSILEQGCNAEFGAGESDIAQLFEQFLQRMPRLRVFGEIAKTKLVSGEQSTFLPEEAAFYQRYFPDVTLDQIAQRRS